MSQPHVTLFKTFQASVLVGAAGPCSEQGLAAYKHFVVFPSTQAFSLDIDESIHCGTNDVFIYLIFHTSQLISA